jgi:hypothetical protein
MHARSTAGSAWLRQTHSSPGGSSSSRASTPALEPGEGLTQTCFVWLSSMHRALLDTCSTVEPALKLSAGGLRSQPARLLHAAGTLWSWPARLEQREPVLCIQAILDDAAESRPWQIQQVQWGQWLG